MDIHAEEIEVCRFYNGFSVVSAVAMLPFRAKENLNQAITGGGVRYGHS
jgi:hypothetical protein